ncbi:MAG: hypothetical protein HY918_00885 [Candidatus Doudnabacteria bacterium]|nr:hypothetical protein [Candidatus Doudnabacteria bacterium]
MKAIILVFFSLSLQCTVGQEPAKPAPPSGVTASQGAKPAPEKKTGNEPLEALSHEEGCRRARYFFYRPDRYLQLTRMSGNENTVQNMLLHQMTANGCDW